MKKSKSEHIQPLEILDPLGLPMTRIFPVDRLTSLDLIAGIELAKKRKKYFLDAPGSCDLCTGFLIWQKYMIDGMTKEPSRWAFMCENCFKQHGVAIGWGFGQLYLRLPTRKWLLVAGSAPT